MNGNHRETSNDTSALFEEIKDGLGARCGALEALEERLASHDDEVESLLRAFEMAAQRAKATPRDREARARMADAGDQFERAVHDVSSLRSQFSAARDQFMRDVMVATAALKALIRRDDELEAAFHKPTY